MFEEFAVWARITRQVAIRYVGFRNLETSRVWIAFGNFISELDEDDRPEELKADELFCADAVLEKFLNEMPSDEQAWKPTIAEAVSYFRANIPDGS